MGREGAKNGDFATKRPTCQYSGIAAGALISVLAADVSAHVFVSESLRVGAYPPQVGTGWRAEVYLNLPISASEHLLLAEDYIATVTPDFTFQTDWIDFPAGPVATDLDENFSTMTSY